MFLKPHNGTSNAKDTAHGHGFQTLLCERTRQGSFKMPILDRTSAAESKVLHF